MNYSNIHNRLVTYRKEFVKNYTPKHSVDDSPMLKLLDRKISAVADLLPQQGRVVSKRKAKAKRENAVRIANSGTIGDNC